MMLRKPPALANWLLDSLGYTRQNAALAGDLLEEFRNGRSAGWYWRQTLAVIAKGIGHNALALRFLIALFAGFAVQFGVVVSLWSLHYPGELHASGWVRFGAWALMQATLLFALQKWRIAWSGADLRTLCAAGGQFAAVALWSYCSCALTGPPLSRGLLAFNETFWLAMWILVLALIFDLAAPAAAEEIPEDYEPCLAIPQEEPVLTVALSGGRTILLSRNSLAESVFAAADQELIKVVFQRGRSLEFLRRAIWIGWHRTKSHISKPAEAITLSELSVLLKQVARTKCIEQSCVDANQRKSFWARLSRSFRGDPV